ncbi:MAG TPA: hypothetical protein VII29_17600 [Terriglobales bacterium]|jgi:hypothetical protein
MSSESSASKTRKQKAKHELRELMIIFLYLAFFFCALVTYSMLLLNEYHVRYLNYAFALINALVITKVIMIGEYAHVGKRGETKPLVLSALWKAFIFTLLVFAFHVVEEVIKRLIHGAAMAEASRNIRFDELAGRCIVVFCVFIPFFAFREFRRVLGEDEFKALVFGKGEPNHPTVPGKS